MKREEPSVEFNDPDAWGYCSYCAFIVATELGTGVMLPHQRIRCRAEEGDCNGSRRVPLGPAPYAAKPRKRVTLLKKRKPVEPADQVYGPQLDTED